jgi:hypothetical protein
MDGNGADLARLEAEVATLRAELDELRKQLATEVRTQRVVVVDGVGHERALVAEDGFSVRSAPGAPVEHGLSLTIGESPNDGQCLEGCLAFMIDEHPAFVVRASQYDDGTIEAQADLECRRPQDEPPIPDRQYPTFLCGSHVRMIATED